MNCALTYRHHDGASSSFSCRAEKRSHLDRYFSFYPTVNLKVTLDRCSRYLSASIGVALL